MGETAAATSSITVAFIGAAETLGTPARAIPVVTTTANTIVRIAMPKGLRQRATCNDNRHP